jgi:hypothetical protein
MFSHRILLPILMSKMALEGTPPPTWVGSGGAGLMCCVIVCDQLTLCRWLFSTPGIPRVPPEPLAANILIAADIVHWNHWSSFYSIHQSMLMAAWHPGWRAHREAAVDVQSYFSTTGSPRKDKEIREVTDVRTVMCGWLMPNSLARYE